VSQPSGSLTGKDGIALNDMAAQRSDDQLVRISDAVIFHRDALRPVSPEVGEGSGARGRGATEQLSLDIDDM
jgi:hypothetical protein